VGQKVSTSQGSYQNLAAGGGVVSQSQYQDVSLTLKVTPQISENDAIRLKLEHQNDALTSQTGSDGNPTISDSQFKTNVMVNSGQILVIGGLISNDTEESVQKVPFLGSIPLIGRLFQYRSDSLTKKNLLIFLRPIVLHDRTTANKETLKRYSMVRDLQLTHKREGDILLPKGSNTVLPQWPSAPLPQPFSASCA
jgi:general secretion pathway protein D